MSFALTLPALLVIPLCGVLLIVLGSRPKATALYASILNLVPGFWLPGWSCVPGS